MICIVHIGSLVIMIVVLIFVELGVISHISILLNINNIKLIMIIVVGSIFCFVVYYISGDVSLDNFKLVKLIFLRLIILILSSLGVLIFVG